MADEKEELSTSVRQRVSAVLLRLRAALENEHRPDGGDVPDPESSLSRQLASHAVADARLVGRAPPTVSLFDPSERPFLRRTLRGLVVAAAKQSALFVLLLLLFYGSAWSPFSRDAGLTIAISDADGGTVVGAAVRAASLQLAFGVTLLVPPLSEAALSTRINAGDFHGGFFVPANASAALLAAYASPSYRAYDPSSAMTFIFDEGRASQVVASLMRTAASTLSSSASFLATQALLVDAASSGLPSSSLNPAVVSNPIGVSILNLHPVAEPGLFTISGLGFIDCWTIMLGATLSNLALGDSITSAGIRREHALYAQIAQEVVLAAVLAIWPPVIVHGIGSRLSASQAVSWWLLCWLALLSFGQVITWIYRNLSPSLSSMAYSAVFVINLVSSTSVVAQEQMPSFFRIGLGLPYANAVQASRTILFGSYNKLGTNIGVLWAWIVLVWLSAVPKALRFRRELKEHEANVAAAREAALESARAHLACDDAKDAANHGAVATDGRHDT